MTAPRNNWQAILDVRRWRKSGNLGLLQTKLWKAICAFEIGMNDAMARQDGEDIRRWGHGLCQLAHVYTKVITDADLEQRLAALEAHMQAPPDGGAR
jgi:hypothetical protein